MILEDYYKNFQRTHIPKIIHSHQEGNYDVWIDAATSKQYKTEQLAWVVHYDELKKIFRAIDDKFGEHFGLIRDNTDRYEANRKSIEKLSSELDTLKKKISDCNKSLSELYPTLTDYLENEDFKKDLIMELAGFIKNEPLIKEAFLQALEQEGN